MTTLRPELNEKLFLRDPQETSLGRKIIMGSIQLIDKLGFEQFTFKKLAQQMGSTEASLYRYFENKHRLLIYLISWHWAGLRFQIRFHTHNIADPRERLRLILRIITSAHYDVAATAELDEAALYRVVVAEASKTYLTHEVDEVNHDDLYREYKGLCADVAAVVQEITPHYPYPHALVSTLLEAARKQIFFSRHLPSLADAPTPATADQDIFEFLENLAFSVLTK